MDAKVFATLIVAVFVFSAIPVTEMEATPEWALHHDGFSLKTDFTQQEFEELFGPGCAESIVANALYEYGFTTYSAFYDGAESIFGFDSFEMSNIEVEMYRTVFTYDYESDENFMEAAWKNAIYINFDLKAVLSYNSSAIGRSLFETECLVFDDEDERAKMMDKLGNIKIIDGQTMAIGGTFDFFNYYTNETSYESTFEGKYGTDCYTTKDYVLCIGNIPSMVISVPEKEDLVLRMSAIQDLNINSIVNRTYLNGSGEEIPLYYADKDSEFRDNQRYHVAMDDNSTHIAVGDLEFNFSSSYEYSYGIGYTFGNGVHDADRFTDSSRLLNYDFFCDPSILIETLKGYGAVFDYDQAMRNIIIAEQTGVLMDYTVIPAEPNNTMYHVAIIVLAILLIATIILYIRKK